ncbi:MAG: VWA-like domain-containing protein [Lachnospiraceae bacterium]|nr:VWA-like domain-containing protein [Lachnospiraceae bacterium]
MEVSDHKLREYTNRIMKSRMRLLCDHGFYGLLLMHTKMGISDAFETAWTDTREWICINPAFLESVSDQELDYVLMHELLHIVLCHLFRMGDCDEELYNVAADIVVNSNIVNANDGDEDSVFLSGYGGVQIHKTPDGEEGWKYTVEELYRLLQSSVAKQPDKGWDHHPSDGETGDFAEDPNVLSDLWKSRVMQACKVMGERDQDKSRGLIPAFAQRFMVDLMKPQTDWRTVLDEFIQEEINDYSFCPPDKRFDDCDFYLPDYNEKDFRIEKILFMIDTSGSMTEEEVTRCYSEIKGAIDQFNGKLEGRLGFFDAAISEPKPFSDVEDLMVIKPEGGGGTDFSVIFAYVREHMADDPPVSIVILTDGLAPFPDQSETMGIPVLWIIDHEEVTPPWGKVARLRNARI